MQGIYKFRIDIRVEVPEADGGRDLGAVFEGIGGGLA